MNQSELLKRIYTHIESSSDSDAFNDALAVLSAYKQVDKTDELKWSYKFKHLARERLACGELTPKDAEVIGRAYEKMLLLDAQDDFDSYLIYMELDRDPKKRFYQPRRHVLKPIVKDLQDLADDKLDFLSVSLPPRIGKSTLCIFFLTWIMGKYPDKANVMSGHSDKLTKSFHMEALSIINDSSTYRFNEVFPDAPFVDSSNADETIHLGAKRRFPTLTCRSIDGTLTGAVEVGKGALLYCDDLVSDREEALNKDRMDKLYSAYLNQLKDRMLDGAKQLFVGTRWVPNDPIGRIEAVYADNPRYRFSTLPALNAQGESNFDYHYNLGFSTQYYQDMKRTLQDNHEEDSWSAKYMCEPYWREGLMFEPEELNYYESLPEGDPDAILAVCDTKGRGSDYCVQPIVYVYGDRHYVVSVVCDNSAPEYVESKLIEDLCEHKVSMARYESNLAGGRVAKDVQKACLDRGHVIDIQTKFSTSNKETRILTDSPWIKSKCFFKREGNGDYNQFMKMLTSYTLVGKNKHDDAPDAMSMYKRFVESAVHSKVEVMKRPF